MNFEFSVILNGDVLNINLKGELDANNAGPFLDEMKKHIGTKVSKIIIDAKDLAYIASAGLRVIIFTKQKIGYEADVILKSPQEAVLSVFEMSGLDNFVTVEK